jgi:hypothetical protein
MVTPVSSREQIRCPRQLARTPMSFNRHPGFTHESGVTSRARIKGEKYEHREQNSLDHRC